MKSAVHQPCIRSESDCSKYNRQRNLLHKYFDVISK